MPKRRAGTKRRTSCSTEHGRTATRSSGTGDSQYALYRARLAARRGHRDEAAAFAYGALWQVADDEEGPLLPRHPDVGRVDTDEETVDELWRYAETPRHGHYRDYLFWAISYMKDPRAVDLCLELLDEREPRDVCAPLARGPEVTGGAPRPRTHRERADDPRTQRSGAAPARPRSHRQEGLGEAGPGRRRRQSTALSGRTGGAGQRYERPASDAAIAGSAAIGNSPWCVVLIGGGRVHTVASMTPVLRALVTAALIAAAALPSAADAASKRCGSVGSGYDRLHVQVVSGSVSCRTARRVMRRALHNGGAHIGKWRCDGGAGGVGCLRRSPRARILGTV